MTTKQRMFRNAQIVKAKREGKIARKIAHDFNLSINQIFVILRQYEEQHGVI